MVARVAVIEPVTRPKRHCLSSAVYMTGDGAVARDENNYNFRHFPRYVLWADTLRTIRRAGVQPGEFAPDFELPRPDGQFHRLSTLRGRPVVLHFGSYT